MTAIKNVSSIGGVECLQVRDRGRHFAGNFAAHARVLTMGAPLNGNTLDPHGKNLMIEIGRSGKVLERNRDDRREYEDLLQRRQRQQSPSPRALALVDLV